MPRFVVLTHDHPFLHWDFMLEWGAVLRTWRLHEEPGTSAAISAEALPDHRRKYLDYEGPVSGDRGEVQRWDAGDYVLEGDESGRVTVRLQGARLRGTAVLEEGEPGAWTFRYSAG